MGGSIRINRAGDRPRPGIVTMKISFSEDEDTLETSLNLLLDGIPFSKRSAQNAGPNTVSAVDASNKKLLNYLVSQWRDMILTADHEFLVIRAGQQKSARSTQEGKNASSHQFGGCRVGLLC